MADSLANGDKAALAAVRAKLRADLVALRRAVRACARCGKRGGGMPGHGEPGSALFMLAGVPGPGAVASNPWGSWWDEVSSRLPEEWGWDPRSVYLSTALRCPLGRVTRKEVQRCSLYLAEELNIVGPRLVLVSGKVAAVAVREALGGEAPANPRAGDAFTLLNSTFLYDLDVARIGGDSKAARVFWEVLREAKGYMGCG